MNAKTIKSALGLLQDDPDHSGAWNELRGLLGGSTDMSANDLAKLLDAARRAHEGRREVEPVAMLLQIEVDSAKGTPREAELLAQLARVLDEDLLDDEGACVAYERLRALRPEDRHAVDAIERSTAKRARWRDLVERYVEEAHGVGDGPFRS